MVCSLRIPRAIEEVSNLSRDGPLLVKLPTRVMQPRFIAFLRSQLSPRYTYGTLLTSWACGTVSNILFNDF